MAVNRIDRGPLGSLHLSVEARRAGVKKSEASFIPAAQIPQVERALAGESLDMVEGVSIVSPEALARITERGRVADSRRSRALSRRKRVLDRGTANGDEHLVPIHAFTGIATLGEENGKPIVIPVIEPLFVPAPNRKKGLGKVGAADVDDIDLAKARQNPDAGKVKKAKGGDRVVFSAGNASSTIADALRTPQFEPDAFTEAVNGSSRAVREELKQPVREAEVAGSVVVAGDLEFVSLDEMAERVLAAEESEEDEVSAQYGVGKAGY